MQRNTIIFDMDGTILDTLEDLKNSLNYSLTLHGYPTRTLDEVRTFVGNGMPKLIERGLPSGVDSEKQADVYKDFTLYYKNHCKENTKPYDGVVEAIRNIRNAGYRTAVVSNKANYAVLELCDTFFSDVFHEAIGEMPGIGKKPAPDMINIILSRLNTTTDDAIYVGDSEVDIMTAKNANLPLIAVDWGFKTHQFLVEHDAHTIISHPDQLLAAIQEINRES